MLSKPGTPCNDYNGYCDVFQRCREVIHRSDFSTTLRRISNQKISRVNRTRIFSLYLSDYFSNHRNSIVGGSKRTTGNSTKTFVGRYSSEFSTLDDQSLVHRCSNRCCLAVNRGKFRFVYLSSSFIFLFEQTKHRAYFYHF